MKKKKSYIAHDHRASVPIQSNKQQPYNNDEAGTEAQATKVKK